MIDKQNAGIGRREFIQVSSAVAAGAVLLGPEVLASELATAPKRLAVGFVNYILDKSQLNALDVVSANEIIGTDGGFISRGARVSVVSTGWASADPRTRRAVELNANFEYFDGAERRTAPFHAWTYDRTTGDAGNPISFFVPVDEQQQIRMSLGTEISAPPATGKRRAAGGAPASSASKALLPFTLSLKGDPDSYRLVRGYFILVPLAEGQSEPSWSSYKLWYRKGHWSLHEGSDLHAAEIEHLVVRVSYGA